MRKEKKSIIVCSRSGSCVFEISGGKQSSLCVARN
jgi:hypothetical protein